jgi:hypothetical protein
MSVLPDKDLEQIQFCESHYPIWNAAPTTVGLTAAQCTLLNTQTKASRDAYTAAQNARQASKAATTTLHTSVATMKSTVADMIKSVKSFAANSANPGAVYAAAQIPMPQPPTPQPAPGMPEMITVTLNPGGSITLNWKAKDASPSSGAVFNVSRKIGTSGMGYASIGPAQGGPRGFFSFTDDTIPYGTQQASYIVQGFRGTQAGTPGEAVNVQFGVGGGGGMAITSGNATLKMAA